MRRWSSSSERVDRPRCAAHTGRVVPRGRPARSPRNRSRVRRCSSRARSWRRRPRARRTTSRPGSSPAAARPPRRPVRVGARAGRRPWSARRCAAALPRGSATARRIVDGAARRPRGPGAGSRSPSRARAAPQSRAACWSRPPGTSRGSARPRDAARGRARGSTRRRCGAPSLLLLLLLLLVLGWQRDRRRPASRRLAEGLQRNRSRLGGELGQPLGRGRLRVNLGAQRLLGDPAIDALVGRHVVVGPAVADDDVVLVDGAIVRRIVRDPAVRGRPELDPGVALGGLAALAAPRAGSRSRSGRAPG